MKLKVIIIIGIILLLFYTCGALIPVNSDTKVGEHRKHTLTEYKNE